jgi:flagellar biosynthesis/type III secretory pathway protein FliH
VYIESEKEFWKEVKKLEKGMYEEGKEEGIKKGKEEGIKEGIKKGKIESLLKFLSWTKPELMTKYEDEIKALKTEKDIETIEAKIKAELKKS